MILVIALAIFARWLFAAESLPEIGALVPAEGRLRVLDVPIGAIPDLDRAIAATVAEVPALLALHDRELPLPGATLHLVAGGGPWRLAHWSDAASGRWAVLVAGEAYGGVRRLFLARTLRRAVPRGWQTRVGAVRGMVVVASDARTLEEIRERRGEAVGMPVEREAVRLFEDDPRTGSHVEWRFVVAGDLSPSAGALAAEEILIEEIRSGERKSADAGSESAAADTVWLTELLADRGVDRIALPASILRSTAGGERWSHARGLRSTLQEWVAHLERFRPIGR